MTNISVRLPPEIERGLEEESRLSARKRSDLVREAVGEHLTQRQRQRLIDEYAEEMRRAYADPEYAKEMRRIQQDFDEVDNSIEMIEAEEFAAGIDADEKRWE